MALIDLLVRPVTIVAPTTVTNGYGDAQLTWGTGGVAALGWLAQQSSTNNLDGRTSTTTGLVLVVPAGTPITATCRVVIDGRTYEVDGEPTAAWTPRGEHHIEARCESSMADVKVVIDLNRAGVRSILTSGAAQALLASKAAAIAAAASATGGEFGHDSGVGGNRARASVWTADYEARVAEARNRALTRAIDAGRG